MLNVQRLLGLGLVGLALSAPATAQSSVDTIAGRLTASDRFVSLENENGLDAFRFDQRNWGDFDILFAAVVLDGSLLKAVTTPGTSATLFAPNDRAFQLLAFDLTGDFFFTEQEVLDAIVGAVTAGAVDLTNVLGFHVVDGRIPLAGVPFFTPVATLNGDTIEFRPRFFGFFVELVDNVRDFRNPFLLATDLDAGNSIIHVISRVLIPTNVGG